MTITLAQHEVIAPKFNIFMEIPALTSSPVELFETILLQGNMENFEVQDSSDGNYNIIIRKELMYLEETIRGMEEQGFTSITYSKSEILMSLNSSGSDDFLSAIFKKSM